MTIIDIINKKRNEQELNYEEIKYAVDGYLNGKIKDYQMSALLMAITIQGMTEEETFNLTEIMLNSGEKINLDDLQPVVDKHSTGGVGDKTTLILAPLVASCGVNIAKMSGRGLGFTGGTIDKLESIPGFNTSISIEKFKKQVRKINIAIVGQMGNLVPADKKIYALRDVTGTVESIPLIASSIMSKKLASGAKVIIIDVKVGNGALMKTEADAKKLADILVKIGKKYDKKVVCFITNMDEPLGYAIGNSLEVLESINTLIGKGPKDLTDLVIKLATEMVSLAKNITQKEAEKEVKENIKNGKAYDKFKELVKEQNGNLNQIEISKNIISIKSIKEGYISKINALELGELARILGAGRLNKEDEIDFEVGIILNKKVGDHVNKEEELLKIYYNDKQVKKEDILKCFEITKEKPQTNQLIKNIIK
jgi:pyrimidine-nucleoside phosphorylase